MSLLLSDADVAVPSLNRLLEKDFVNVVESKGVGYQLSLNMQLDSSQKQKQKQKTSGGSKSNQTKTAEQQPSGLLPQIPPFRKVEPPLKKSSQNKIQQKQIEPEIETEKKHEKVLEESRLLTELCPSVPSSLLHFHSSEPFDPSNVETSIVSEGQSQSLKEKRSTTIALPTMPLSVSPSASPAIPESEKHEEVIGINKEEIIKQSRFDSQQTVADDGDLNDNDHSQT